MCIRMSIWTLGFMAVMYTSRLLQVQFSMYGFWDWIFGLATLQLWDNCIRILPMELCKLISPKLVRTLYPTAASKHGSVVNPVFFDI